LLSRVRSLRRHFSAELGFLIPPVHISDNLRLRPREYLFSLRGLEIGRWQTEGAQLLAVSGDPGRRPLAGKETREPAFGVPAIWIAPAIEDQAIAAGYSVVDAVTVMTTHLGELIRRHAWELLGRAETKRLMDSLNESHPKLLEELVPKLLTLGEVGRVLEQLLRERVSIRDLGAVLEALLEAAPVNKNVVALVEAARQALGRRLIRPLLDNEGQLPVLLLDPALEEEILVTLSPEIRQGERLLADKAAPAIPLVRRLADSVRQLIGAASAAALPVLLVPSPARYHVKRWLEPVFPRLAVVAAGEIPPEIRLRPVGTVR
jgi:flagellar biosynthesis protein FlhA